MMSWADSEVNLRISLLTAKFSRKNFTAELCWLANVSNKHILSRKKLATLMRLVLTWWHCSTGRFWWRGCGPQFCSIHRSASWNHTHGVFAPKLNRYLLKLGRICCIGSSFFLASLLRKSPQRMHWCFLINYVCLLWLRRTGFGINFGLELCAWPWKYSAWFSQTLTAN